MVHVWTAICTSQCRSSIIAVLIYGLCENLSANGLHKSCFEPKPWPAAADLWSFVSLRNAFMVESKHEMVNLMLKHHVLTVSLATHAVYFYCIFLKLFMLSLLLALWFISCSSIVFYAYHKNTNPWKAYPHVWSARWVMLISLLIGFRIILLTGRIIRI